MGAQVPGYSLREDTELKTRPSHQALVENIPEYVGEGLLGVYAIFDIVQHLICEVHSKATNQYDLDKGLGDFMDQVHFLASLEELFIDVSDSFPHALLHELAHLDQLLFVEGLRQALPLLAPELRRLCQQDRISHQWVEDIFDERKLIKVFVFGDIEVVEHFGAPHKQHWEVIQVRSHQRNVLPPKVGIQHECATVWVCVRPFIIELFNDKQVAEQRESPLHELNALPAVEPLLVVLDVKLVEEVQNQSPSQHQEH
mmetsp:Transcript_17007/g.16232  ORF Transcript_17007/g.16232 Transcript_17007/m.16232 type:complete len:256 (+) Transcript_17007:943-1710(+)